MTRQLFAVTCFGLARVCFWEFQEAFLDFFTPANLVQTFLLHPFIVVFLAHDARLVALSSHRAFVLNFHHFKRDDHRVNRFWTFQWSEHVRFYGCGGEFLCR
jgi:hypothetical protein